MSDGQATIGAALRILMVEDSDDDATLIACELEAAGFAADWQRVDNARDLAAALAESSWDVVLSDHVLPGFSSLQALRTTLGHDLDAPFIIVSGRIGEEAVAAALREGAVDYVNKDDLSQLGPAVRRGLSEAQALRRERELQRALLHSQAQLAEAQRLGQIGSWEWDAAADRLTWSAEMYRIYGRDADDFELDLQSFLGCVHEDDRERLQELIGAASRSGGALDYEHRIRRPDGEVRTLECRGTVVVGSDGATIRMFGTGRDISERTAVEERAHETHARLQALLDYAPFPISLRDLDGRFQLINRAASKLMGYPAEQAMSRPLEEIMEPHVAQMLDEHERIVRDDGRAISFELTSTHPEGGRRDYLVTKYPVTDADGTVTAVGGISIDITERKRAEERVREAEERFRNAFENAPIGKALVDLDGTWMRVNRAVCEITGFSAEELLTKTFQDITHPDDLDSDLEYLRQLIDGEIPGYQMEKRYFNAQQHVVWVNLSVSLLRDATGEPSYFIAQIQDISERKRLEERLRRLADHDPLTGARNRRLFQHDLGNQVGRCQRYGEHAALLMLDLDDFKQINDTHGHKAGDDILTAVAAAIKQRLRGSDVVARIGGDEFAVIVSHTDAIHADALAVELKSLVAACAIETAGHVLTPSVSIGVALMDETTSDGETVLIEADRAMYVAKRAAKTAV